MIRVSQDGLRRRVRAIRGLPAWDRASDLPEPAPRPPRRRRLRGRHKLAIALLLGGVVGLPLWIAFRDADMVGSLPQAPKPSGTVVDVEIAPPSVDAAPEVEPTEPVVTPPPDARVAAVPSTPSVGLVSTGPAGGSGNGAPGLDLGLEGGAGSGMAVASGGGGSGGGVGTGTGSGIGTSRFVYQVGQVDQDAKPSGTLAEPAYPRRADEDGIEALVEVRALIDERGRVEQVEVLGAPAGYGFEASVRKASARWRFEPARLGGVPVPQWVRIPWHFKRPG